MVVEVGSTVQQLDVGEAGEEQRGTSPGTATGSDPQAEQAKDDKVDVHPRARPGLQPAKAQIGEVISRLNVKRANPPVSEVSYNDGQTEQAEDDAERRCRCAIDRAVYLCLAGADPNPVDLPASSAWIGLGAL